MPSPKNINKKLDNFNRRLDNGGDKFITTISKPIYLPFFGLLPVLLAAVELYNPCTGFFCDIGQNLDATIFIGIGGLFALITGVVIGIKYRKTIRWQRWLLLWVITIAIAVGALLLAMYHKDHIITYIY
jgi:hydrogenase/urease accessory protein HupE